jgi:hypothetical protein
MSANPLAESVGRKKVALLGSLRASVSIFSRASMTATNIDFEWKVG